MTKGTPAPNETVDNGGAADPAEAARWAALAAELDGEEDGDEGEQPEGDNEAPGKTPADGDAGDDDGGEGEGEGDGQPQRGPVAYAEHENVKRALRTARESERQVREQMNGVTALINNLRAQRQQQEQPKQEEPKQPTVEEDPIGYFQAELAKRDRLIEELRTGSTQTRQQIEQSEQQRAFANTVMASEAAMRASTPDYDAACQHLEAGRVAELEAIYADDNPQAIAMAQQYRLPSVAHLRAAILDQDRIAVAQQALMLGQSPAELYYRLAKQRGYKPPEPGKQPGGKTDKAKQAANVIDTMRRGKKAATSLNGGTGGGPDNMLSIADLTELYAEDPEAFDKEWDRMARAGQLG